MVDEEHEGISKPEAMIEVARIERSAKILTAALSSEVLMAAMIPLIVMAWTEVARNLAGVEEGTPQVVPVLEDGEWKWQWKVDPRKWWEKIGDGLLAGMFPPIGAWNAFKRLFGNE